MKKPNFNLVKKLLCATLTVIACIGSTPDAHADEIPVIATETAIARGESKTFEFGTVPQQDTTVLLEVTSRLDAETLAGSSFFMRMELNGHEVNAAKSRSANRLKNRAFVSNVAPNVPSTWFGSPAGWRVLFAPDFESARKQTFYEGDPYTLVLDVTDLTNPAAENRLTITNNAPASAATYGKSKADLIIQKLTIKTVPGKSPMMDTSANIKPFINRGERAGGPAKYVGAVLPGGGFTVAVGNRTWKFNSAFSFPNAGFNSLSAADKVKSGGQPEWKVQTAYNKNSGTVAASGREYSVQRDIKFTPRKIEIADAITNKTNAPLGLLVRDEMDLSGLENPAIRLAGSTDPAASENFAPGNPSVHVTAPDHTIAMICEDDVFRNQAKLYTTEAQAGSTPVAGLRTEMLRLAPNETYTLRWSVYPVASLDYFDFINLVRQDWGANYTTLGAWWWGFHPPTVLKMPLEELRAKLNRQGINYATIGGGWVDASKDKHRIGFGTGVMDDYWADYRKSVREAGDKLRLARPGIKVMAYYDTQRDTSEGDHERFKDSWLTDAKGNQLSTEWSGQYSLTYSTVATLDNSYGKAMLKVAEQYFSDMKLDGIYWDEMENVAFGVPLLTYNIFDGHSAILNPKTFTIEREVGNTALLGEGHRLAVIDIVKKHNGVLLGNGPTGTKALLDTHVQRMIESQHNDYWSYQGHLATPLGYISGYTAWKNYRRLIELAMLPVAIGIDMPHDVQRHLFPFTPIELHSGYLLGKERIVVAHDGHFGWDGNFRYRLWTYDGEGRIADENPAWQNGKDRVEIKVPENGLVVMEREL
jgi:hypothetical protein